METNPRYLVATLVLAAAAAAAKEPGAAPAPELWVELVETTGLDEHMEVPVQVEVEAIYRSAGVAIRWLEESPTETAPHVARVYLMETLPASLHRRLRVFHDSGAPPMALGLGTEGDVSGAVLYVSRAGVVAKATNGALVEPPPEQLARALGRVIAHELAHRFLQKKHTRRGVLKADFSQSDLVGDGGWARFTEREARRLREIAYKESPRRPRTSPS